MSMFDNYPSPEGYIPDNRIRVLPLEECPPYELPNREYNIKGEFIGYSWRQGDTLLFHYSVDDYIKDRIDEMNIRVRILEHNRCEIYSTELNGNSEFDFPITKELSDKMIRGNYYFVVEIYNDNDFYTSSELLIIVK